MKRYTGGGIRSAASKGLRVRVTEQEHEELRREADQYGYEFSSFLRLRIFGKRDGLRVIRRPPVETRMLGDALGQLGQTTSELNKVGSNLNQISKRLNQGSRDLFMLDSSLRWFERVALQKGEAFNQAQIKTAVDLLAANLGMKGHQRVIVEHRKDGRQHFHIVFNMINPTSGRTASLSWSRKIEWNTSRQLEQKFGLKSVVSKGRPSRQWEHQRGKRSGIDPVKVRKEVTAIYRGSKTGKEFIANLDKAGYVLTKGRNNSYVIIDRAGDIHGLMRRIEGATLKDLRQKFPDLKSAKLPILDGVLKQRRPMRRMRLKRLTPRKRIIQPTKRPGSNAANNVIRQAPRLQNRPNKYAALTALSSKISRPTRSPKDETVFHAPIRIRNKRKGHQNVPDSEKMPIRRAEMDAAELIAWAFENGRFDVLASFGIHLSPEAFEP